MAIRELLSKFFIVACNLNQKLIASDYLFKLSDNTENNYKVFENFTRECSSTLLCVMHKLGHCDEVMTLIISRHIEVREYFHHEEDDAGGYINEFHRRIINNAGVGVGKPCQNKILYFFFEKKIHYY